MINNNKDSWNSQVKTPGWTNPCGCTEQELNYIKFAKNILSDTEPRHTKSRSMQQLEELEKKCQCVN